MHVSVVATDQLSRVVPDFVADPLRVASNFTSNENNCNIMLNKQ
jgi:hypothetical protein